MVNSITLTNASLSTSTAVKLLAGDFSYSWKNLSDSKPGNGYFAAVENQFNGWENPIMNLTFHIPVTNPSGTFMTWALWNQFVKAQHLGTSSTCTYLNVTYGASDSGFNDYSASTSNTGRTAIPISILGYTLSFSPTDSDRAAHWTINAQIQVTKDQ